MSVGELEAAARDARQAGDLSQALNCWRAVTEMEPDHLEAHFQTAITLLQLGEIDEAHNILRLAVTRWPQSALPHAGLAWVARRRNRLHEALECWRQAEALEPSQDGLVNTAIVLMELGRTDEARALLNQAVERWPQSSEANVGLAFLAQHRGRWSESLTRWRSIREDHPQGAEAPTRIALILFEMGKLADAEALMNETMRRWPGRRGPLAGSAWLAERSQNWQQALERWRAVAEQYPEDAEAPAHIAEMLLRVRRFEEAEQFIEQSITRRSGDPALLSPLVSLLIYQDQGAKALEKLQELLSNSPESMPAEEMPISRPEQRARRGDALVSAGEGEIVVATSIAPRRLETQERAIASWLKARFSVRTLNTLEEIQELEQRFSEVQFFETRATAQDYFGLPLVFLDDLLDLLQESGAEICGFINSDITFKPRPGFFDEIRGMGNEELIFCRRVDLYDEEHSERPFFDGVDAFFLKRQAIPKFLGSNLVIGAPWWDLWMPAAALLRGMAAREVLTPVAYHPKHPTAWSKKMYRLCGFQMLFALNEVLSTKQDAIESFVGQAVHLAVSHTGTMRLIPELIWNSVIDAHSEKIVLKTRE